MTTGTTTGMARVCLYEEKSLASKSYGRTADSEPGAAPPAAESVLGPQVFRGASQASHTRESKYQKEEEGAVSGVLRQKNKELAHVASPRLLYPFHQCPRF